MQHYPTVLQRKTPVQSMEHTVSRIAWVYGDPDSFFLAQFNFLNLVA